MVVRAAKVTHGPWEPKRRGLGAERGMTQVGVSRHRMGRHSRWRKGCENAQREQLGNNSGFQSSQRTTCTGQHQGGRKLKGGAGARYHTAFYAKVRGVFVFEKKNKHLIENGSQAARPVTGGGVTRLSFVVVHTDDASSVRQAEGETEWTLRRKDRLDLVMNWGASAVRGKGGWGWPEKQIQDEKPLLWGRRASTQLEQKCPGLATLEGVREAA